MILTKLQGAVTHLQQSTEITGFQGAMRSFQAMSFRVNNRQVANRIPTGYMGFSEGDEVTLLGREKSGTVQVWCIRNDTTGAVMYAPSRLGFIIGGMVLLMGILLTSAGDDAYVFGIPLAALGVYLIHKGWRVRNANNELTATRAIKSASI